MSLAATSCKISATPASTCKLASAIHSGHKSAKRCLRVSSRFQLRHISYKVTQVRCHFAERRLRHETAFPTIFAAITSEDKRALGVLSRCSKDETGESLFGAPGWRRAISSCSEEFLNFMTQLEDPTPCLENNLKGLLDFCNVTFEKGRLYKAYTDDPNWPESRQNKALVAMMCILKDMYGLSDIEDL